MTHVLRWLAWIAVLVCACTPYRIEHRVDPVPYTRTTPFVVEEDVPFDPSLASEDIVRRNQERAAANGATEDPTVVLARDSFSECLGTTPHLEGLIVAPAGTEGAFELSMTLTFHGLGVTRTAPVGAAGTAEASDGSSATGEAVAERPQSGTTSGFEVLVEVRDPEGQLLDRARLREGRFPGAHESVEERVQNLCELARNEVSEYLRWRIQGG